MSGPALFDRALHRKRAERRASGFAGHAVLHERAMDDVADRLALIQRRFERAVLIGRTTPASRAALLAIGKIGSLISLAPSAALADAAPAVVGDEEALPFAAGSVDLFVSILSLHTLNDVPGALVQMRRALKPDGLLLAVLLGGDTLGELRTAFATAEAEVEGGVSPRVAPFADVRTLGGLLQRAGFALPVADSDLVTLTYASPLGLLRDLRGAGCSNTLTERRRTPLRRATLARMLEIYGERFPAAGDGVAASMELVTLTGWAPHESQQKPLSPGSARMPLADALRGRR